MPMNTLAAVEKLAAPLIPRAFLSAQAKPLTTQGSTR